MPFSAKTLNKTCPGCGKKYRSSVNITTVFAEILKISNEKTRFVHASWRFFIDFSRKFHFSGQKMPVFYKKCHQKMAFSVVFTIAFFQFLKTAVHFMRNVVTVVTTFKAVTTPSYYTSNAVQALITSDCSNCSNYYYLLRYNIYYIGKGV